jgi:hypothetical protein
MDEIQRKQWTQSEKENERQRNLRMAQDLLDEEIRKRMLETVPEIRRNAELIAEGLREEVARLRHNQGLEPIEFDLYLTEKEAFGEARIGRRKFSVHGFQSWDYEGKRVLHIRFFPE